MNSSEIKKRVRQFKREFQVQRVSNNTLEQIFEKQGFTIVQFNRAVNDPDVNTVIDSLGVRDMITRTNGFLYVDKNYRIIFLNERLADDEKLLVMAHEEGHYYCGHSGKEYGRSVVEEFEANEFAHYLLKESAREKIYRYRFLFLVTTAVIVSFLSGSMMFKAYKDRQLYEGEYYITMTGQKYHIRNCVTIEGHPVRRLTKKDVESGIYEPCSVCLPND